VFLRSPIKGVFPVLSGALMVAFFWAGGILLLIIGLTSSK
jgi:hypothetical protein